jgi:DNA-binding HxlR family transcriptional regulator
LCLRVCVYSLACSSHPSILWCAMQELKGSMRAAKLKGSLLTDRLRSLQKRNIVEVRSTTAAHPSKRRRYQLKTYTTKAGKIDEPPTIA